MQRMPPLNFSFYVFTTRCIYLSGSRNALQASTASRSRWLLSYALLWIAIVIVIRIGEEMEPLQLPAVEDVLGEAERLKAVGNATFKRGMMLIAHTAGQSVLSEACGSYARALELLLQLRDRCEKEAESTEMRASQRVAAGRVPQPSSVQPQDGVV